MDISEFLFYDGTTMDEYTNALGFEMRDDDGEQEGIVVDEEEGLVKGFPASRSGKNERPWFNYEEGTVGCTCDYIEDPEVNFCRHVLALFNSLSYWNQKYAEKFMEVHQEKMETGSSVANTGYIPTGLDAVDDLLGGGIPRSVITLLGGTTKVGKTWFGTQIASFAATQGYKVLYFDDEGMFQRPDSYKYFEDILRNRWDYDGPMGENIRFITKYDLNEIANMFGHSINISYQGHKAVATAYKNVKSFKDTAIFNLCKAGDIDLVIFDSFTKPLKSIIETSKVQSFVGRGDVINSLIPAFEAVVRGLGVGFIMIAHAARNHSFSLEDIMDKQVKLKESGIWGGYSLMHHISYFLQLEDSKSKRYEGKNVKHLLRRLWSGGNPTHIDLQFRENWGFTTY